MQLLLDHLGATIIAGTVVLMVVTLQLRAQQTAIEQAVFYRGKAHTLTFAEMIGTEFPKIGEGTDAAATVIQDYSTVDGQTEEFAFILSSGGGSEQVRYSLIQDGTVAVGMWDEEQEEHVEEQIPVYRLERTQGSGSGQTVMTNVKQWHVDLLDSEGQPTAVTADARQLKVRLSCLFEAGEGESRVVHRTVWGTTFRPTGLQL